MLHAKQQTYLLSFKKCISRKALNSGMTAGFNVEAQTDYFDRDNNGLVFVHPDVLL
jgi:hypothetical protein